MQPTQNGPAMPYSYATVLDCNRVAAQVQAETMPLAINPGLTLLLAVLNSSLVFVENLVYRFLRTVSWDPQVLPPTKLYALEYMRFHT